MLYGAAIGSVIKSPRRKHTKKYSSDKYKCVDEGMSIRVINSPDARILVTRVGRCISMECTYFLIALFVTLPTSLDITFIMLLQRQAQY
jgi:hypothetical protein